MNNGAEFIPGASHTDHRGTLSFINDFKLDQVKRLYMIEHPDTNIVRAWQGHKVEQKWFFVIKGRFRVMLIQPDDWEHPSATLTPTEFILDAQNVGVLHIPAGFANGFKALENHSQLLVCSDASLEESGNDNYRFDPDLWFNWNT